METPPLLVKGRKAYAKKRKFIRAVFTMNDDTSALSILNLGHALNELCDRGTAARTERKKIGVMEYWSVVVERLDSKSLN
jgi:hypothetical protein